MLAEFGEDSTPYLLGAVRDEDMRVRETACSYIGGLDPLPEEGLALCLSAMEGDREPRVRSAAAASLGLAAFGAGAARLDRRRRIVESLLAAGRDVSPMVRYAVMKAMVAAHAVGVDLGPWLSDPSLPVRLAAAEAMLRLDPSRKGRMVPVLQAMILQAGPGRAADVARPLDLLFRADPLACRGLVPTFVSWLGHEDAEARGRVVIWLAHLGPMARDAAPTLEPMLAGGRPADRARAAFALIHIDPAHCDRAAACLLAMLGDASAHPRDRGLALRPFDAMFRLGQVPARLRDQTLRRMRAIPDQPGIHPELGLRIRQFVDFYGNPRPPRGFPGATARLISTQ